MLAISPPSAAVPAISGGVGRPTNAMAFPISDTQWRFTWTNTSARSTGQELFYGDPAGGPPIIQQLSPSTTSVDITCPRNPVGQNIGFLIRAYTADDSSDTRGSVVPTVSTPTNLVAKVVAFDTIRLTWIDNSPLDAGAKFQIQRGIGPFASTFDTLKGDSADNTVAATSLGGGVYTFDDTGALAADADPSNPTKLQPGVNYSYRVVAVKHIAGQSASAYVTSSPSYAAYTTLPVPQLTGHRTGGRFGDAVVDDPNTPTDERQDAANYVILANNDYEENADDGNADNADGLAMLSLPGQTAPDNDLARFTLNALPATLRQGTLTLTPTAAADVRFFDNCGTLLSGSALTLDLANPQGYLARLLKGPADVWMEGINGNSNLGVSLYYGNGGSTAVASDSVRMTVVNFSVLNGLGQLLPASSVADPYLLADIANGVAGTSAIPEETKFKLRFDGLSSSLSPQVQVTTSGGASYSDTLETAGTGSQSSAFRLLYDDALGVVFNPAVLPTIALAGLNAFITLTTAADVQSPKNAAYEAELLPDRAQVETLGTYTNNGWSSPFAGSPDKKMNPGVGIRSDGVFPNLRHDPRDLVRVILKTNPDSRGIKEYRLGRYDNNISVWATRQSGGANPLGVLNDANDVPMTLGAREAERAVWVQWEDGRTNLPDSFLKFRAVDKNNQTIGTPDRVRFYPFRTLVVLFAGHLESEDSARDYPQLVTTNADGSPNKDAANVFPEKYSGAHMIGLRLYKAGYDVAMFSEDPGNSTAANEARCGIGFTNAVPVVTKAIKDGGVKHIVLFGYSHGGGLAYDMSTWLSQKKTTGELNFTDIPFSAYIDAVQNPHQGQLKGMRSVTNVPKLTTYHLNFYQSRISLPGELLDPHGVAMQPGTENYSASKDGGGTDIDSLYNRTTHSLIDRDFDSDSNILGIHDAIFNAITDESKANVPK